MLRARRGARIKAWQLACWCCASAGSAGGLWQMASSLGGTFCCTTARPPRERESWRAAAYSTHAGSPHEHHAWAVALVAMPDESLSLQAIAASAKVANHAKKQLVIAMPELAAARVQFVVLSWARLRRRYYDAAPATAAD